MAKGYKGTVAEQVNNLKLRVVQVLFANGAKRRSKNTCTLTATLTKKLTLRQFHKIPALVFICLLFYFLLGTASSSSTATPQELLCKKCEAIVLGKIVSEKIDKIDNYYITEYKLKTKKWLYKKNNIEETKYIKLKVLGASLPKKGIVIKSSCAPNYIPIKKDAIFILKQNKLKQKNVFTLSKDSIIQINNYLSSLKPEDLNILLENTEEI